MKAFLKKKLMMSLPIIIGVLLIVCFLGIRVTNIFGKSELENISSSTLIEVVNIAELSTAKFYYNGIAEVKEGDKVKCYIRYDSEVTAGIQMDQIDFTIDEENKVIKPILPPIEITNNILTGKLKLLPDDYKIEYKDAEAICKADAEKEANDARELKTIAEENVKSIVEGLLEPIVQTRGYTINWE